MNLSFRENKSELDLSPIDEHPDYRKRQEVVDRLKTEFKALSSEKTALINRANQYRKRPAQILAEAYLQEAQPVLDEDGILLNKRIGEINLRIHALTIAIQAAEKEVVSVKHALSLSTAEAQADGYRAAARVVLAGMVMIQRANSQIEKLGLTRQDLGYNQVFHPVGMSPWPYWGDHKAENSAWSMIMKEFLEAGHITDAEHYRLTNGSLEFQP
jgi:hypothetical protein